MMKKLFFTLIAALVAAFGAHAVTADEVMQKTATKVTSAPSITFKFTATTGDGAKASGSLVMAKACFTMSTPQQSIWYDGRTMWSYSASAQETNVTEPHPDELLEINPFDILNQYTSLYTAKLLTPLGKDQRVELSARKSSMAVKRAVIVVDAATSLPKAIDVTFANSARLNVLITAATVGKVLSKSTFTYPQAKYPKAEVIDLR